MGFKPQPMTVGSSAQKKVVTDTGVTHGVTNENAVSLGSFDDMLAKVVQEYFTATNRSEAHGFSADSLNKVEQALSEWENAPWGRISTLVRSASYLEPQADDPDDYKRLTLVFENVGKQMEASHMMQRIGASPYSYYPPEQQGQRMEKLAQRLGLSMENIDSESMSMLYSLATMDEDALDNAVERVMDVRRRQSRQIQLDDVQLLLKRSNDSSGQTDEDILDPMMIQNFITNDSSDRYRKEHSKKPDTLSLDIIATRLLDQGYPLSRVAEYHYTAPQGYWGEVEQYFLTHEDSSLESVYEAVQRARKDHFYPDDRPLPRTR